MNGRKLAVLATASLAFFTHSVFASNYIQCDTCNYTQMENAAIAHGVGRYVVGNVTTNAVYAFQVYLGTAPNVISGNSLTPDVTSHLYAEDGSLTSQDTAAFTALYNLYNAVPVGYQKQYTLQIVPAGTPLTDVALYKPLSAFASSVHPMAQPAPGTAKVYYPGTGENVYTFINSGAPQNGMLNWVGSQNVLGINSAFANLVNSSVLHTIGGETPQVYVTVVFTDGSHIGVYVDFSQSPPAITVNENSGVDSHGNNVPATKAAITGSGKQIYDYAGSGNATDKPHMLSQLSSFGVTIPAETTEIWECMPESDGVRCIQIQ